jgi:hypothetical protein
MLVAHVDRGLVAADVLGPWRGDIAASNPAVAKHQRTESGPGRRSRSGRTLCIIVPR